MVDRIYEDKKIYTLQPGEIIFKSGDGVQFLAMIVVGEAVAQTSCGTISLSVGDMLGIADIWTGNYGFDYVAVSELKVCMYACTEPSLNRPFFHGEKRLLSVSVLSMIRFLRQACQLQNQWYQRSKRAYGKLKVSYEKYKNFIKKYGITAGFIDDIQDLEADYQSYGTESYTEDVVNELSSLTIENVEGFLGNAPLVAMAFLKRLNDSLLVIIPATDKDMQFYYDMSDLFYGKSEESLFSGYYRMALKIRDTKGELQPVVQEMNSILALAETMEKEFCEVTSKELVSQSERLRDAIAVLHTQAEEEETKIISNYTANEMQEAHSAFAGLTKKLLEYAGVSQEKMKAFLDGLTAFRVLAKNQFRAPNASAVIREFEALFYELYEAVFKQKETDEEAPFWVNLFLDYGILSDVDFGKEDQVKIYHLAKERTYGGTYHVYTISQWLHKIYIGEKEPSRDELGRDYKEFLQEIKKKRSLSLKEEKEYMNDAMGKVRFEIKNFFRANNRIVYSANATFCPFATGDEISGNIAQSILSYERLVAVLDKIRGIDFAVFYREYSFYNKDGQIKSLRLMTEVLPDIILIPHVGYRASMWQEIEGRKRVSPARFAIPLYPQGDLYEMVLHVVGRYRWEFCRTEQGVRWNDVSEKSLTSEYFDYIQFYRKNNDLSDAAKQKLKDRVARFRNNVSEIFISDYMMWVKYESEGANRLNKVCRGIMAEYCLFGKDIRSTLKQNPMFEEAIRRVENKRTKKEKEFERYLLSLENKKIVPERELEEHMNFLRL